MKADCRDAHLWIFFALTLGMCLLTETCQAAETPDALSRTFDRGEAAYEIGAQNLIQIKIFGEGGLQQIFRVDEMGMITHPLAGRVELGGLTVAQAEHHMEGVLHGDYILNPKVTIFVLEHSRFSIMGEVRKPGAYEIMGRVSVIEAISMAGGFTQVANKRNIKILRKANGVEETVVLDTSKLLEDGDRKKEHYVRSSDVIVVPKSFF